MDRCKLVMDNGQTIMITVSPEKFISVATDELGVMRNEFIKIRDAYINPTHVSFIISD
ncbi:hypothetical protein RE628_05665 [Paenibacillus sp. D2_2]|uniref:hypothetical protein n=1 Tax=Paenibacillus sp. D2_2 TaxID=3073092 RepID=UPI002815AAAE|nr:hypothetical protein [Paenibacillus sp. D2_2]WMT41930.1 hypothetical protein RE628_05665 [Paenibacillus sp. D2_2]